ncbi:hypothetical protein [Methylohalomonas lacus]|nr:hypothetical protein [Methylohalomonas lacus]
MPAITFIIPGFLPAPAAITAADLPACPYLQKLLARADQRPQSRDSHEYLLAQFGCPADTVAPYAALSHLADRGETRSNVLRADPVHLSAGREGVMLFDNTMLQLQADEAESLAETVRPLLTEFAAELEVAAPERWYLLCEQPIAITTQPLMQVIGRDVSDRLPTGDDRTRCRRLFNEIQMTLHEAPVNQTRERRGQLPVNSLWFWGEGDLPALGTTAFDACFSNDPLAQGLARWRDIPVRSLPANLGELLAQPAAATAQPSLLVLDNRAERFHAYQDAAGWLQFIERFEQDWAQPLYRALRRGQLSSIDILPGDSHYHCRRRHVARFWRRPSAARLTAASG